MIISANVVTINSDTFCNCLFHLNVLFALELHVIIAWDRDPRTTGSKSFEIAVFTVVIQNLVFNGSVHDNEKIEIFGPSTPATDGWAEKLVYASDPK